MDLFAVVLIVAVGIGVVVGRSIGFSAGRSYENRRLKTLNAYGYEPSEALLPDGHLVTKDLAKEMPTEDLEYLVTTSVGQSYLTVLIELTTRYLNENG